MTHLWAGWNKGRKTELRGPSGGLRAELTSRFLPLQYGNSGGPLVNLVSDPKAEVSSFHTAVQPQGGEGTPKMGLESSHPTARPEVREEHMTPRTCRPGPPTPVHPRDAGLSEE